MDGQCGDGSSLSASASGKNFGTRLTERNDLVGLLVPPDVHTDTVNPMVAKELKLSHNYPHEGT